MAITLRLVFQTFFVFSFAHGFLNLRLGTTTTRHCSWPQSCCELFVDHHQENDDSPSTTPSPASLSHLDPKRRAFLAQACSFLVPTIAVAASDRAKEESSGVVVDKILIAYCTNEGQTERIARRIAHVVEQEMVCPVKLWNIKQAVGEPDLSKGTTVIIGGSVHSFRHAPELAQFVRNHVDQLNRAPLTAFYSVSLMAAVDPKAANALVNSFLNTVEDWHPNMTATFGGAARYSEMDNRISRTVVAAIVRATGLDRPPWRDKEYTDWTKVDEFALAFCQQMKTRLPVIKSATFWSEREFGAEQA
jgi:menaquinone-dependent protoporphyrinogen oxidase